MHILVLYINVWPLANTVMTEGGDGVGGGQVLGLGGGGTGLHGEGEGLVAVVTKRWGRGGD